MMSSRRVLAAVRKNGVPVWFLTGKDEGHGFAKKHNRDFQFVTELEFIETYLLP